MKKRHFLVLASFIILISSCEETKTQEEHKGMGHAHKEKSHIHSGNESNKHMHQKPVEQLIKNFESSERDEYQKPEEVLKYLGDIAGKKIIDIGAGSGYFSVKLAEKGANVIAADVSDEFQAALKKRIEDNKLKNIELRKIPFDSPSIENEEVDMVLIVNTYHHIENRSNYFEKVKAGTKQTGELVLIDFFKSEAPVGPPVDHKISIDKVLAELKKAGYSNFDINVNLLPYQYIIRAK